MNEKIKNPFKIGDKVIYKTNDDGLYIVYGIYSNTELSLGLRDYQETEQDYMTDIKDIVRVERWINT